MKSKQDNLQIAAFVGGKLDRLEGYGDGKEVVLALPLNRLVVKMVSVPADADPLEVATPILQKMSPFPDEPLTVGLETVRENEHGKVMIAAALPESAADDIGEALDGAKLNVQRIDALVLGALRGLWQQLGQTTERKLVLIKDVDCISIVVLDGDGPSAIRAIVDTEELRREVMLSLLEAEDFGGARKLAEIVVVEVEGVEKVEDDPFAALEVFAPVRKLQIGAQAALVGIAERSAEEGGLDALPASWREVLVESRFKAKMIKHLAVAGGIWLLIMGVLFGVPMAYGFMTDYQNGIRAKHKKQFEAVKAMKDKVMLVRKYSDHDRGALEIMKALSDRLPAEITLTSWNYKREEGLTVIGDGDTAESVYEFKDKIAALASGDGEDEEKIFKVVELKGPNMSRGKHHFELSCQYKQEGAE